MAVDSVNEVDVCKNIKCIDKIKSCFDYQECIYLHKVEITCWEIRCKF